MTYKIAKLVSDYVSPGVYVNRLELGDAGFNGPVDLRFIGEPGWIENAHSVFFGVNGRDAYYPTNTGGLITTSDTGDLVFFDPSNAVGRTLSQLYSGGSGLWEVSGSYSQLITARPINLRNEEIAQVTLLRGSYGTDFSLRGSNSADSAWIEFLDWDHASEVLSLHDGVTGTKTLAELAEGGLPGTPVQGNVVYYNGAAWVNLAPGTNGHFLQTQGAASNPVWAASSGEGLWEVDVTTQLITADDIDIQGYNIIGIGDMKAENPAGIDVDNSAGVTRIFLGLTNYSFKAQAPGDMSGNDLIMGSGDITGVDEIKGSTITPCHLDFRGDDAHRIWYTGTSDNRLQYKTYLSHEFVIQAVDVLEVKTTGIHMKSGKYIKSDSGDLELRAPSGSKIKFVIG